jgi:hypothetical protein
MKGLAAKGSEFESKASQDLIGKASKLLADPTSSDEQQKRLAQDREIQQSITDYNMDLEHAHTDVRFTNKTFTGNHIIIKLEKNNWLIPSNFEDGLHTMNPLYFLNVVTPDFPSGKMIQNPLPYGYKGTVIAIGDEVSLHRKEKGLTSINPGDSVELGWFDLKEHRYYPDKQKVDQITLDNPYAPNYEGFAKVPAQFVEAFVSASEFELVYGKREELYKVDLVGTTMVDYK